MGCFNPQKTRSALELVKLECHGAALDLEALLCAIPASVALLDDHGGVVQANLSWHDLGSYRGDSIPVGTNFLEVCEYAQGEGALQARAFAGGIREVILGKSGRVALECHWPLKAGMGRFIAFAEPISGSGRVLVAFIEQPARGEASGVAGGECAAERSETSGIGPQGEAALLLWETMNQGVVYCTGEARYESINPAARRILGRTLEELPNLFSAENEHPVLREDGSPLPVTEQPSSVALRTGQRTRAVLRVFNPREKAYRWVNVTSVPILRNGEGGPSQVYCLLEDITERRAAEQVMVRYKIMCLYARDPMLMFEVDGQIIEANQSAVEFYGYSRQELLGMKVPQLRHPSHQAAFADHIQLANERGGIAFETLHVRRDHSVVPVEVSAQGILLEGKRLILSVARDLSERKRVEEALRGSEERFHTLADSIPQLAWIADREGVILWYNQRCYDYLGLTPEQLRQAGQQSVLPPERAEEIHLRWMESVASGTPFDMEFPLRSADGSFRMFLNRAIPLKDSHGCVLQWFGTNTEIGERIESERKLFEINQRLHSLMNALPVGVCFSDDITCERIVGNPAMEAQMGALPGENFSASASDSMLPGRGIRYYSKGNLLKESELPLQKAVAENCEVPPSELEMQMPDGRRWFAEVSAAPIRDASGKALAGVAVSLDITERKRTENERNCTVEFLSMVNRCTSLRELLQNSCAFFKIHSGCDAVTIRVLDSDGRPLVASPGVSPGCNEPGDGSHCCCNAPGFVEHDSDGTPDLGWLSGCVLQGRCQAANERGTFWCSDLAACEQSLPPEDRESLRVYCSRFGFCSLALIPLGQKTSPVGVIQLKSRNKSHFNAQSIAYWERLADKFLIAVEKFQAQEALKLANNELEKRVRKRTAELEIKNSALAAEILEHEKTEEALRRSEARFRLLAENSTDMIGRFTPEGVCVYVSPASLGLLGFVPEELVGTSLFELCHPEDRPELLHYHALLLNGSRPVIYSWRGLRKNGNYMWLETSCRSVRDPKSNGVLEIQSASRDITIRKAVEEALKQSEASLRTLSNHLPDGAIFQFVRKADGSSRYSFVSDGAKQLFGLSPDEELKDLARLEAFVLREDQKALLLARRRASAELSAFDHEARIRTPSGEIKWMHWRAAPRQMPNGDVIWDGVMTNVTRRRRDEHALQRANRALRVLKECDEALVRASGEHELFQRVCAILVEVGIAKMAWVGQAEQDRRKSVLPLASAGDTGPNGGYLRAARISWADNPRGRGPTGTAIRTGNVVVCHDVVSKPELKPWRDQQLQQKLASSIALPLFVENRRMGALTLYSSETDAFNPEEVELLQQLAGDLSFGISALRTRAKRRALEEELLRISEREKQLIAQELHDGLCQHLTGTAFLGSVLYRKLVGRGAPEAEMAKQICDQLSIGASEARNLSHGLHPVRPEPEGLMDALSALARTTSRLFQLECSFRCSEPVSIQDPAVANHLFRIAQEAINNAIKHGSASEINIRLKKFKQGIALSIRDNGVGIGSLTPRSTTKGMGLQIMGHRAAAIGASLSVQPSGKHGTLVNCALGLAEGA